MSKALKFAGQRDGQQAMEQGRSDAVQGQGGMVGMQDTLGNAAVQALIGDSAGEHRGESGDDQTTASTSPAVQTPQTAAPETNTPRYSLATGVTLPNDILSKVAQIATAYHTATQKTITVTSGTRSASSQARAMYDKLVLGDDIVSLYANRTAVTAIKEAYDDGKTANKTESQIIADMTAVIEAQIESGVYISKHLVSGAVDVRSSDMSSTEKDAFRTAATGIATSVALETTPPHWHLQF